MPQKKKADIVIEKAVEKVKMTKKSPHGTKDEVCSEKAPIKCDVFLDGVETNDWRDAVTSWLLNYGVSFYNPMYYSPDMEERGHKECVRESAHNVLFGITKKMRGFDLLLEVMRMATEDPYRLVIYINNYDGKFPTAMMRTLNLICDFVAKRGGTVLFTKREVDMWLKYEVVNRSALLNKKPKT